MSFSDDERENESVVEEREAEASPDVEAVEEGDAEDETLEQETEEESEERESERIEEREDDATSEAAPKRRTKNGKDRASVVK